MRNVWWLCCSSELGGLELGAVVGWIDFNDEDMQ